MALGPVAMTDAQARFIRRAHRRQWGLALAGLLVAGAGGAYAVWAVGQVQREPPGADGAGFDRPIARLERLAAARREPLDRIEPRTEVERRLLDALRAEVDLSARLLVMSLRLLLASAVVTLGVVFLTVTLTERQYLRLIAGLGG